MFPIENGFKRPRALDIGVGKPFLGPRTLSFPPRVILSHIWTTHGRKMLPTDLGVKRSKAKCTGIQSRNMISRLKNAIILT
jgi:hypothetical protein